MKITLDNLADNVVSLNEFPLSWRFLNKSFDLLSLEELEQLKPLNKIGANFLSGLVTASGLLQNTPSNCIEITDDNSFEVRKWFISLNVPLDRKVFLTWQPDIAMIIPWEILIKYFDSFYYPVSDDLTVIDATLNWTLLFFHYDKICFIRKWSSSMH